MKTAMLLMGLACWSAAAEARYQEHVSSDEVTRVRRWLVQESQSLPSIKDAEGRVFKWHLELYDVPPADELEKLRERVRNHPEHPDRVPLERFERWLSLGGRLNDPISCYYINENTWRIVNDLAEVPEDGYFMDSARNSSQSWVWQPRRLAVMDSNATSDLPIPTAVGMIGDFHVMFDWLFIGPLSAPKDGGWESARVEPLRRGGYSIVHESDTTINKVRHRMTRHVEIDWDAKEGRGRPRRSWITYEPSVEGLSSPVVEYGEPIFVDAVGRHAASRVTVIDDAKEAYPPLGRKHDVVLDSVEVIQEDVARSVVRPPSPERPDPIRGELRASTDQQDFRGRSLNSDAAERVFVQGRKSSDRSWGERTLSWLGLAALVVVPVLVWRLVRNNQG